VRRSPHARPPARATIIAAPTTTRTDRDPPDLRRGVGSALLRAALDRADREGSPADLEATSRRNRALYERHAFVTVGELTVADCPPLYAMWRPPA
jgi:GNAT superfamily N-acetyltransferase